MPPHSLLRHHHDHDHAHPLPVAHIADGLFIQQSYVLHDPFVDDVDSSSPVIRDRGKSRHNQMALRVLLPTAAACLQLIIPPLDRDPKTPHWIYDNVTPKQWLDPTFLESLRYPADSTEVPRSSRLFTDMFVQPTQTVAYVSALTTVVAGISLGTVPFVVVYGLSDVIVRCLHAQGRSRIDQYCPNKDVSPGSVVRDDALLSAIAHATNAHPLTRGMFTAYAIYRLIEQPASLSVQGMIVGGLLMKLVFRKS